MRVLVTDGDERAALAATRSLGRAGTAHVVGTGLQSLAGVSRFASSYHRVVSPYADSAGFAARISDLSRELGIEAVLPISDAACRALLSRRLELPGVVVAPSLEVYERLSDKESALQLARETGILTPRSHRASSPEEAVRAADEIGWPVILKPVSSIATVAPGVLRKTRVSRVDDAAALQRAWHEQVGSGAALVQELVPGRGEGLFYLRSRGRTLAVFAHRRLREKPPAGGVSVLRESIAVDPELASRVEKILESVGLDGVAMAEFRRDGATSRLMEFNVRLWGSVQLAIDAGIDFPRLLVESSLGSEVAAVARYDTGVRSRWLLGDVDHALALARGQGDATGLRAIARAAGVLFRPTGPRSRLEVLRSDDLRPFVHELRMWLAALVRRG